MQSRNITNQEIIDTIKDINFCGLCTTGDCDNCVKKISKDKVISLLCKDTAIKPKKCKGIYNIEYYECPNCGEGDVDGQYYCETCGQKLDWD